RLTRFFFKQHPFRRNRRHGIICAAKSPNMSFSPLGRHAALIIAHPGHELRVYGWLNRARPLVFVLTDGSGHTGRSRLNATTRILRELGSEPGGIYGRLTDAEIYSAIIERNLDLFVALTEELAEAFVMHETDYVVADALEGYNP